MGTELQWQNVAPPSFSGAVDDTRQAAILLSNAFSGFGKSLQDYGDRGVASNMAKYTTKEALEQAIADGTLDTSNASSEMLANVYARQQSLLQDAISKQSYDQNQLMNPERLRELQLVNMNKELINEGQGYTNTKLEVDARIAKDTEEEQRKRVANENAEILSRVLLNNANADNAGASAAYTGSKTSAQNMTNAQTAAAQAAAVVTARLNAEANLNNAQDTAAYHQLDELMAQHGSLETAMGLGLEKGVSPSQVYAWRDRQLKQDSSLGTGIAQSILEGVQNAGAPTGTTFDKDPVGTEYPNGYIKAGPNLFIHKSKQFAHYADADVEKIFAGNTDWSLGRLHELGKKTVSATYGKPNSPNGTSAFGIWQSMLNLHGKEADGGASTYRKIFGDNWKTVDFSKVENQMKFGQYQYDLRMKNAKTDPERLEALRNEWQGLRKRGDQEILNAIKNGTIMSLIVNSEHALPDPKNPKQGAALTRDQMQAFTNPVDPAAKQRQQTASQLKQFMGLSTPEQVAQSNLAATRLQERMIANETLMNSPGTQWVRAVAASQEYKTPIAVQEMLQKQVLAVTPETGAKAVERAKTDANAIYNQVAAKLPAALRTPQYIAAVLSFVEAKSGVTAGASKMPVLSWLTSGVNSEELEQIASQVVDVNTMNREITNYQAMVKQQQQYKERATEIAAAQRQAQDLYKRSQSLGTALSPKDRQQIAAASARLFQLSNSQ